MNAATRKAINGYLLPPGLASRGIYNATTSITSGSNDWKRTMALYVVGEGWTGALGQELADQIIPGHHDDEHEDINALLENPPRKLYDGHVKQAAVGWGHTAIIDDQNRLLMIGRPHDFLTLLRLYRLPTAIRYWIARRINTPLEQEKASFVSALIEYATGSDKEHPEQKGTTWDEARKRTFMSDWTPIDIETENRGVTMVAANAGLSAMLGKSGTLYTFGLNNRGQCGIGSVSNNVWSPTNVSGLTTTKGERSSQSAESKNQEEAIIQVSLGLQHGLALSVSGNVYSWGKAGRGQLGREIESDQDTDAQLVWTRSVQIASGMHHGALLTKDNEIFLWGKNMLIPEEIETDDNSDADESGKVTKMQDARTPQRIKGLPPNLKVVQIACGSHHLAILMEDGSVYALGIAADVHDQPLLKNPIKLVPSGVLQMPCRQFEAHQDRTTIVDGSGHVYQAHLWKDQSLQDYAMFTPSWADVLEEQGQEIQAIHRGWLHTAIVTTDRT